MITVSPRRSRVVRRIPPAVPLDGAHPELAARGRARRLRGRRRRLSQEQRHDDRAALQPDEAQPRRRAGPRPHHRGRDPRAWTRRRSNTRSSPGSSSASTARSPSSSTRSSSEKAIAWRDRGRRRHRHRRPRVRDVPGRRLSPALPRGPASLASGSPSIPASRVRSTRSPEVVELLEPDRIGHGVKAAYDPRTMEMIRERGIVLEICPTCNLNTRVVSGWDEFRWIFDTFRRNEVRFTINTDGPEMLKTYIRDEMAQLGRLGILSVDDQEQCCARRRSPRRSCRMCRTCRRRASSRHRAGSWSARRRRRSRHSRPGSRGDAQFPAPKTPSR